MNRGYTGFRLGSSLSEAPKLFYIGDAPPPVQTDLEKLIDFIQKHQPADFRTQTNLRYASDLLKRIPDAAPAYAEIIRRGDVPLVFSDMVLSKVRSYVLPLEAAAEVGNLELATRFAPRVPGGLSLAAIAALNSGHSEIYEALIPRIGRLDLVLYGIVRRGDFNSTKIVLESIDDPEVVRRAYFYACGSGHIVIAKFLYVQIQDDDIEELKIALHRGFDAALEAKHHDVAVFALNVLFDYIDDMYDMTNEVIVAIMNDYMDIAHSLVPYTAKFEKPIEYALAKGDIALVDEFLKKAEYYNVPIADTYIIEAISMGAVAVQKFITHDNACKMTIIAFRNNNIPVLRLLLNYEVGLFVRCIMKCIEGGSRSDGDLMTIYDSIVAGKDDVWKVHRAFIKESIILKFRELTVFFMRYDNDIEEYVLHLIRNRWYDLIPGFPEIHFNGHVDLKFLLHNISCVKAKTRDEENNLKIVAQNAIESLGEARDEYIDFAFKACVSDISLFIVKLLAEHVEDADQMVISLSKCYLGRDTIGELATLELFPRVKDTNMVMKHFIKQREEFFGVAFVQYATVTPRMYYTAIRKGMKQLADAIKEKLGQQSYSAYSLRTSKEE